MSNRLDFESFMPPPFHSYGGALVGDGYYQGVKTGKQRNKSIVLNPWNAHVARVIHANPQLSLPQASALASHTYVKKAPKAKAPPRNHYIVTNTLPAGKAPSRSHPSYVRKARKGAPAILGMD